MWLRAVSFNMKMLVVVVNDEITHFKSAISVFRERTCGSSKALMMAANPNMLPMVPLSSAAIWIILCSKLALSSVVLVQPSTSTATVVAMV